MSLNNFAVAFKKVGSSVVRFANEQTRYFIGTAVIGVASFGASEGYHAIQKKLAVPSPQTQSDSIAPTQIDADAQNSPTAQAPSSTTNRAIASVNPSNFSPASIQAAYSPLSAKALSQSSTQPTTGAAVPIPPSGYVPQINDRGRVYASSSASNERFNPLSPKNFVPNFSGGVGSDENFSGPPGATLGAVSPNSNSAPSANSGVARSISNFQATSQTDNTSTATSLAFSTQPSSSGTVGTLLSTQPIVTAKNSTGSIVTTYGSSITLTSYASANCTGAAVSSGFSATANPVTSVSGVATFSGLTILKASVQSIQASDGTLTVCSNLLTIAQAIPSTPSGLTASADTAHVGLSWTAASGTGPITYTILRSTTSGSGYTSLATGVSATTYSDATASNGTTYYYVVNADNAGGASANSTEVSARPISNFTISSVQVNGNAALQVSWGAATGASAYTLKYGTSSGSYGTVVSTNATSPATISSLTPGTTYYFRVVATNAVGSGNSVNATSEVSGIPIATPGAPAALSATAGVSNVGLSWTASTGTGPITYSVLRSTTSGSGYASIASGLNATSYSDFTALNGTTYYYVVAASNTGGTSATSTEVSARPISSFAISAVQVNGDSALQVAWGSATGASAYTLKYGTSSGSYGTVVSTNATSPTTIPGLTPGTQYYFMVVATNAVGSGTSVNASSESSGTPLAAFTISAVTEPAASQATLTFGASTGATSYTVKYGTASGVYGTTFSTSATTPTTVTGLTNGTPYYFMVYAVNAFGQLAATTEKTLTPIAAPSAPTALTAAGGISNVGLSWTASTGGGTITYSILRSTTSGSGYTSLTTGVSATNYSDFTALNGTTYYYVVKASNSGGSSANSTEVSARPISSFTISSVQVNGGSALQVSWGAATGAAAYTLKYGTSTGVYGTTVSTTATSPTTVSALTPGTTYYFMVAATNAVGSGSSVNATSESTGVPLAAFTMTAATRAPTTSSVTWAASSGSTSYTLKYGTATGVYGTTVSTSATSPMAVSGLTSGTTYYYKVTAVNANGTLDSSNEISQSTTSGFTNQWATTSANSSSYAVASNIDFNGSSSSCELIQASQVDNSNVAAGFAGGTYLGLAYSTLSDGSNHGLKLASDGTCNGSTTNCNELSSSWAPQWSNLKAYWKLNGSGALSNGASIPDSAGTNTGTLTHASGTLASYVTGKLNKGISFAGSTDYVTAPVVTTQITNVTMSAWIYWNGTNAVNTVLYNGNAGADGYGLYISDGGCGSGGSIGLLLGGNLCNGTSATYPLSANTWTHVALTRASGGTWTLYINGAAYSTGVTDPGVPTTGSYFGNFPGIVDDLGIWNTALTASEIALIYNNQSAGYGGTFTSRVMDAFSTGQAWTSLAWTPTLPFLKALPDYASGAVQNETTANYSSLKGDTPALGDNNLMTGIVGLWHLDEAAGSTTVADTSGQNNPSTAVSGTTLGVSGRFNKGASFNGLSGSSYIDLGYGSTTGSLLNHATDSSFTFSVWTMVNALPVTTAAVNTSTCFSAVLMRQGLHMGIMLANDGTFITSIYNSSNTNFGIASPAYAIGTWHHIVQVVDDTAKKLYMYVDGVQTTGSPVTYTGSLKSYGGVDYTLGVAEPDASLDNGAYVGPYNGVVDEVAIWKKALKSTEVQQLYQRGASRIKFQARSCSDSTCTTGSPTWHGPDGTASTYFSEIYNMSTQATIPSGTVKATLPSITLQNYTSNVASNRYFQYRAVFESDSATTALMPELKSVTVGPNHYDKSAPTVISKTGVSYISLSNAIQTLGTNGCSSGVLYNLGVGAAYSSATWYWWNGTTWTTAGGTTATANSAATIATNAATFGTQVGTGTVYFKAFLQSSGTSACELSNFELDGQQ